MDNRLNIMISSSVVLYDNEPEIFESAIASFLDGVGDGVIWVSDNSPNPIENPIFNHSRVRYFHNGGNIGFGAGHNSALSKIAGKSEFHLILNPDIEFSKEVLPELVRIMCGDNQIGAIMPRVVYPDGSHQYLAKLLPTPLDLLFRRFIPSSRIRNIINKRYELHDLTVKQTTEVPAISGCFLFARTSALQQIGGFDERYFMYMEDFDLVRRIAQNHKIVFAPQVVVTHHYAKGSYVNITLLRYHMQSAIKYFNKWGWIFDAHRKCSNRRVLELIRSSQSGRVQK